MKINSKNKVVLDENDVDKILLARLSKIQYFLEENAEEIVRSYEPLICDVIPLSLEEVFIYELGGMGYEFEII